ncbi:MAG: ribonuclease P protein component [Rickettsiaceae bacterium]|nr:ribonuclease P protein component [Rickettsiaceae bacterium]
MTVFSLKNQKEFDFVNKHGSKKHGSCFIIVFSENISSLPIQSENATFLGLKISRKFSKKAVVRNKARRRIKHLIDLLIQEHLIDLSQKALIVIPKIGLEKVKFSILKKDFEKTILQIIQANN